MHILSNLKEINEKLNPSYRLSKSTLKNTEKRISELSAVNQPVSKITASVKFSKDIKDTFEKETYLSIKHKPRDWQKLAIRAWESASRKGIVEAATGAGKTALACYCISEFFKLHPFGLVCVVVPRQPLFEQWNEELHEAFPYMPNSRYCYIGNNYDDTLSNETKLLIIMQQTLIKRVDRSYGCKLIRDLKLSNRNILVVVDEAHHLGADETVERFVKHIPKEFDTLGLTATPDRRDGAMDEVYNYFSPSFNHPIFSYPLSDAVEDDVLAKVKQYNIKAPLNSEEREKYDVICEKIQNLKKQIINNGIKQVDSRLINAGNLAYLEKTLKNLRSIYRMDSDYRVLNLVKKVQSLLQCYISRKRIFNKTQAKWHLLGKLVKEEEWNRLFLKGRWIFFHEEIDECQRTAKLIEDTFGKSYVRIHHSQIDTEERTEVLKRFNDGEFSILCAVKTLDEGIDIPDLNGVVIVSGSTNKRQQIQRCGRALRTANNKEYAYLISILSQVDCDESGERLLIGPVNPTNKWHIETITFNN